MKRFTANTVTSTLQSPSSIAGPVVVAVLLLSSVSLLLLGVGSPLIALAPLVLTIGLVLFVWVPTRLQVFALVSVATAVDPPSGMPQDGQWHSILYPVGRLLYENLNTLTGVSVLRFSLLEILLMLMVGRVLLDRPSRRSSNDSASPTPNVLMWGFGLWFATMIWLEVFGLLRGGDVRNSLWQIRTLLWLPIVAWLIARVMRGPNDFVWIARSIIGAAVVKVTIGLYFLFAIVRPRALTVPYIMTHDDTLLLVTALFICLATFAYRQARAHLLLVMTVVPLVLLGIVANDRRIAYVSVFGGLLILYVYLAPRVRRRVTMLGILAMPLFVVYLAVGRHRTERVFVPAAKIMSLVTRSDASSSMRDIENYNLYVTLRAKGRLLGSGFGHKYVESVVAYDISEQFPQYRYIAHNSVLWLWSIAGVIGMSTLWLVLVVGVYFAARSFRFARSPFEQTACVSVIAVVFGYLVQCWGDMGSQSWISVWLMGAMLGTAGKLATATGAWPEQVRLFSKPAMYRTIAPVAPPAPVL